MILIVHGSFIFIFIAFGGWLVSFAAARARVTQRSPSHAWDGERCVTPARVAAKETSGWLVH